jgi:hypothetical protein
MDNPLIRISMKKYVKKFGPQDTRVMIDKFSKIFLTTKQRISGNLSCMACIHGTITIINNRPNSIMY